MWDNTVIKYHLRQILFGKKKKKHLNSIRPVEGNHVFSLECKQKKKMIFSKINVEEIEIKKKKTQHVLLNAIRREREKRRRVKKII